MQRSNEGDSQADGTATEVLERSPQQQCDECGIYLGAHRMRCSRLDRSSTKALALAHEVEAYFRVRMK